MVCSIFVRKPPSSAAVGAAGTSCTARSSHVLTCSGARAGELLPVFGHRSPARSRTAFATRLSRSSCWPLTASAPVRQIPSVKQTQSTNKVWIQTQRVKGTNPSFSYERAYVPSSPHTSSHITCACTCPGITQRLCVRLAGRKRHASGMSYHGRQCPIMSYHVFHQKT